MSAQNVPQMPEEVENRCGICFEDVKKTGDFFGVLDCCGHIHCWECICHWKNHRESQHLPRTCPCCRQRMRVLFASFIAIPHGTDRKERIIQFTKENATKVKKWAEKMQNNGMKVENCPFNCGCAEVMPDGSLMCPHGLYDEKRYEEEQWKLVEQEAQTESVLGDAPFFTTSIVANHQSPIDMIALRKTLDELFEPIWG